MACFLLYILELALQDLQVYILRFTESTIYAP